jgi:hypothetical protein
MQNPLGIQPAEERSAGAVNTDVNTELVAADPIQKLTLIDYQWFPKGGADWKLVIIGRDDCHMWRVTVKRDFYENQSFVRAEIGLPGGGWTEQYTMDGSAFWNRTGHAVHVSEAEPHARQVAAELLTIALRTLI